MKFGGIVAKYCAISSLVGVAIQWSAFAIPASAQVPSPPPSGSVLSPTDTLAGKDLYEWSTEWWKTIFGGPAANNPFSSADPNGVGLTGLNDPSSPVFFLAGNATEPRSITISENRAVFFPLVNIANIRTDPAETASILCIDQGIADFTDTATGLFATLNGQSIGGNLFSQRQSCRDRTDNGPFYIDASPGSQIAESLAAFPIVEQDNLSVTDGYWLMLNGLTPGDHTLSFGGELSGFTSQNNTYTIRVTAVPEGSATLGLLALGLVGAGSALKSRRKVAL